MYIENELMDAGLPQSSSSHRFLERDLNCQYASLRLLAAET